MKNIFIYIFFIFYSAAWSQYSFVKKIPFDQMNLLTSDILGNAYVSDGNLIFLINRENNIFKQNSFLKYGELHHIDASNSLKVLLFYLNQNKIIFVDNTLSEFNQTYHLDEIDGDQITLACASYDNGFWLYNPAEFSLNRYNSMGSATNNVKSIQQLVNVREIDPNMMLESSRQLFVNDPHIGIMIFDIFGGFSRIVPIKNIVHFQVIEKNLVYQLNNDSHIYNFNLLNFKEEVLSLDNAPNESVIRFSLQLNKLYILTSKALYIYMHH